MTDYSWVVTKDHTAEPGDPAGTNMNAIGMLGPRGVTKTAEEITTKGIPFRMLDDDNELYYEGFYLGPDDETLFAPLDDFGTPNAGAAIIQYKNKYGRFEDI